MQVEIEIKGLKELIKMAEKYPSVSLKHINSAITYSLSAIYRDARQESPVKTGQLKSTWQINKAKNFEGSLRNLAQSKKGAYYATFVEFGTSRGIKPQRFLQGAVDSNESLVDKAFSRALDNILKEI